MTGLLVTHVSECAPRPALCLAAACAFNLTAVQGPTAVGSRCGRDLVGAQADEQARALGVSVPSLYRIEAEALRKLRRRLPRLDT